MFFKKKVDFEEVLKWGILGGLFEGVFLILLTVLLLKKDTLIPVAEGWEFFATIIVLFIFTVSFVISSILVFGHPIYSFIQKRYKEGIYTFLITSITLLVILIIMLLTNNIVLNIHV